MIQGIYQDSVVQGNGRFPHHTLWIPNTIVDAAWLLLAGLLKRDPALSGILFFAVGAGNPAWDATRTPANPAATRLHNEILRQAVPAADIHYLDDHDEPTSQPASRIQIAAQFTWPDQHQTLREFGLFGGDATDMRDSGYLVNYVIHPRLHLETGATLTRRLRLSLRSQVPTESLELPSHWLRSTAIKYLDGVGKAYLAALTDMGIETIGQLAEAEPTALAVGIPAMKRVELWSKARLVIRTAVTLSQVAPLFDRPTADILNTPPAVLAAEAGAAETAVALLREQVSILQTALDSRYLLSMTIGELVQRL